jgi:ATP-binding cassette, subfamily B, bacterial CvaB/MchF/RaxB
MLSISRTKASECFTGIVLEMEPGSTFERRPTSRRGAWFNKDTWRGVLPKLLKLLLLSILLQVGIFSAPFFTQWILDEAIGTGESRVVVQVAVGLVLLVLLQVLINFTRGWGIAALASELSLRWSGQFADRLLRLPYSFFQKRHLGDLVSRLEAVHALRRFVTTSTIEAVIDGAVAVAAIWVLFSYSASMTLLVLGAVGTYWTVRLLTAGRFRIATENLVRNDAAQQSQMLETLRGIKSIKVNARESLRLFSYQVALNETIGAEAQLSRMQVVMTSFNTGVFGIEKSIVLMIGGFAIVSSELSLGMLVAFLGFREIFVQRAAHLADRIADMRSLGVHYRRVRELMLTPVGAGGSTPLPYDRARGCLEFENVSFRFSDDEPWLIRDCSFRIEPGECVSITGPSGCGKSTLLNLALGMLKPCSGRILIDGIDLAEVQRADFLAIVGAVLQEDTLFSGTLASNIAFSNESIDYSAAREAAILAQIHDEIEDMTMGYATVISSMGDSLSGGQRQRLLLARALYKAPKILLLDEATSHLDLPCEREVVRNLAKMPLTRIMIAHREETIRRADRVLVMNRGAIEERFDKHESLTTTTAWAPGYEARAV